MWPLLWLYVTWPVSILEIFITIWEADFTEFKYFFLLEELNLNQDSNQESLIL